jgi:prepilin-type processing-associated H-X9-DG protein/prepilin-type N-terminal cleavage/methylation domain-containing protein
MKLRGKAFTLVELLVVMGMIAVLIAIILPALRRVREQSDDARCKANLRELFVAQTFYSDDNQKQYAGVEYRADALWPDRLKKYVTRTAQFPRRLEHCPTVSPEALPPQEQEETTLMSYGVNSNMALPYWSNRRDRKMNAAEMILMGDKALTYDDWLTSDDGRYLIQPGQYPGYWIFSTRHNSDGSYRHANHTRANMLMADGHVAAFGRDDLKISSGHWYWGDPQLQTIKMFLGSCCGGGNGGK